MIRPEFIRLPEPKKNCPHTGLSRTDMYNLTVPCKANDHRPPVPAKNRRKPGNLRGVWLIPYEALVAHINSWGTPGLKTETLSAGLVGKTSAASSPATCTGQPHTQ